MGGIVPWNSETAREAQAKGVESRKRRQNMSLEDRIKAKAAAASEMAMRDLIDAAQGKNDFESLSAEKRLSAVIQVLGYGIGRPRATSQTKPEGEQNGDAEGDAATLV